MKIDKYKCDTCKNKPLCMATRQSLYNLGTLEQRSNCKYYVPLELHNQASPESKCSKCLIFKDCMAASDDTTKCQYFISKENNLEDSHKLKNKLEEYFNKQKEQIEISIEYCRKVIGDNEHNIKEFKAMQKQITLDRDNVYRIIDKG